MKSKRSRNYIKQVKGAAIWKTLSVVLSFMIVPLMVQYLGVKQYGVWSTILSILTWMLILDVGIGNGLRNKVSESIANNKLDEARSYISTTYVVFMGVGVFLIFLVCLFIGYVDWQAVFNTDIVTNKTLVSLLEISFVFFIVNFILSIINQIFHGAQSSSIVSFNHALSNVFSLLFVYILTAYAESSLVLLSLAYGSSLMLSNIILTFWFYSVNPLLRPNVRVIQFDKFKSLLGLGVNFFVVQIAVIVLFSTDKIIIAQLLGVDYVTSYDLMYKVFGAVTLFHSLFMLPLWSSFSHSMTKKDYEWIKKMMTSQLKLICVIVVATIPLVIMFPHIIFYWVGDIKYMDFNTYVVMGLYVVILAWNNVFSMFINSTGYLKLSVFITVFISILNIPLSIFFINVLGFSMDGVLWATICCLLFGAIAGPIQYFCIVYEKGPKLMTQ